MSRQIALSLRTPTRVQFLQTMAEVTDKHRILAHQVYMMGELHGREGLKIAIAQAIADAEERGQKRNDDAQVRTG